MNSRNATTSTASELVRSLTPGSTYGDLLASLHSAKQLLTMQIDSAKREGTSTASLECDLRVNRSALRHFVAYLEDHV
jgi:hypothetical protein